MKPTDMLVPGVDPFDALRGTRVPPWVRRHARARQAVIQIRKRVPIDLAPMLGVEPFVMAKSLACGLSAAARLHLTGDPECRGQAVALAAALLRAEGRCGDGGWGYEFDVQTRWAFYPAGSPNLIATVFVGRAFLEAGIAFGDEAWVEEAVAAAHHLHSAHLDRERAPFFRYTPDSPALVHNANLLGCGFTAAVGRLTSDDALVADALETSRTSLAAQGPDGSWPYGAAGTLAWDDNFHTAYDLDGLAWASLATGDPSLEASLRAGAASWAGAFFGDSGEPRYYRGRALPYDIHSAGTAVDVASRLGGIGVDVGDVPERVAAWTRAALLDPRTGRTWYRRGRWATDRRAFVRWGDAHWLLATSSLALREAGACGPVESALRECRPRTARSGDREAAGR